MKIGLHDAEYEQMANKSFPNLALMKISAYYKNLGHQVEWWVKDKSYDKVFSSKVFDFTPINKDLPENTIKGGTGYGLYDELPEEIDRCYPDYSLYPLCDYAVGFLTRGCINNCSYCVVPKKEGNIRPYANWRYIVRSSSDKLVLMDNNILACEYGINQLKELSETAYKIDLNQGMDVTLLNDEICEIIKKLKWIKYIRFSCDKSYQLPYFENLVKLFDKHKISKSKVFIYILVQKDLEEADKRVQELHRICKSFNLYAQAERNIGIEPDKLQLIFAQKYVYSRCYKKENFKNYCKRHFL